MEDLNVKAIYNQSLCDKNLAEIIAINSLDESVFYNYQNYVNVLSYLNSANITCLPNEDFDKCLQQTKGKKIVINYNLGLFYISLIDCEHYLNLSKHYSWKKNFIHKNFSPEKFESKNIKKVFSPEYDEVLKATAKILKGVSNKGLMVELSPTIAKDDYLKFLAYRIANSGIKEPLFKKTIIIDTFKSILKIFLDSNNYQNDRLSQWRVKSCDILFLEDLGDENITIWSRDENLFEILKYRYDNNLLTFVSTNYTKNDLYRMYASKFDNTKGITKSMSDIRTKKIFKYLSELTDYFKAG